MRLYDAADRPQSITGLLSSQATNYTASSIAYTAAGGVSSLPLDMGYGTSWYVPSRFS